jgi:uncharacterized delta-60 repeat protein
VILNGQVLVPGSTNAANITAGLLLPDGRPVIAGQFSHIGAQLTPGLAVLNPDGSPVVTAFNLSKIEPGVLLAGPGGSFYAGGKGNVEDTRLPLLRFHADGSRDTGFTPPPLASLGYLSSSTYQLLTGPGDTFYVVTAAASPSFTPTFDIVRLTANGAVDTTFADAGKASIPNPSFGGFASSPGGQITFNGVATYRGAALNRKINRLALDGSLDPAFNSSVDPGFGGRVVAVQADGKVLYAGAPNPINRLKADGAPDTGYANPAKVPLQQTVLSLSWFALASDQSLYAGGFAFGANFTMLNGAYHIFGDPNSAPTIAVQPLAQTNTLGARTRFSVTAQGAAPLTYQWYRNTLPVAGGTDADLVMPAATAADDADFHCVVSNGLGSAPTAKVHLTLLPATPGSVYRETDVPAGPDSSVTDLRLDAGGGLFGTGGFVKWNGTNRVRVARLLPGTGDVDPSFDTSALNGNLGLFNHALPLSSGKLLVVGSFSVNYNGKDHREVYRFNANGSLDTTFNSSGAGGMDVAGDLGARPVEGADGKVVLYGSEWNGEKLGGSYFRLSSDGTRDTTFALRGANYQPFGPAIAALTDGRYLVAARPAGSAGNAASCGVIRLLAGGTPDPTFFTGNLPGFFLNNGVRDIVVQPDGRILVGGSFNLMNGGPDSIQYGILRLLDNGRPDPTFNAVPRLARLAGSAIGSVRRLALRPDGWIVALGNAESGGFPRNQLFRFWPSGPLDPSFNVAPNSVQGGVPSLLALAVRSDNTIYVGGDFKAFSDLPRTNFVRLNGGPLQPIPAPPTIASQPLKIVAKAGGSATLSIVPGGDGPFQFQWGRNEVQASTNFVDIAGATNASLSLNDLRVTPQDSGLFQCTVVNPGGAAHSALITLLVEPDPALPGMADTSLRAPVFQGILTGQYQISDVNPDGTVYGSLGNTVVRLFEDGTRDPGFNPPTDLVPVGGGISVVKRQPDGKILIAGRLKDGALARLLADGSYDPDFLRTNNYTGGFQDVPQDIGLQSDGGILLAGTFSNFAGRTVNGLLRFHADGRLDEAFPLTQLVNLNAFNQSLPGRVFALRVLPDDSFYLGGDFNRITGATRHGVARLHADGSLDTGFVPPTNASASSGTSGSVLFYQLGPVAPGGGIYIFGQFRPDLSKPGDTALRLLPDGSIDAAFHLLTDFQINTGIVESDAKLIINGQFGTVNGRAWGNLARVNADGSLDTAWQRGSGGGAGVGAQLQILPDGKLLAGSQRFFTGVAATAGGDAELAFTLVGGGLQLAWPAGYTLQRTTTLLMAKWDDVVAISPFTAPLTGPGEFYRLKKTP